VIASHYAEPVARKAAAPTALRGSPSTEAESIGELRVGEPFLALDESLGWSWGYAGGDRRVGYVRTSALAEH